MKPRSFLVSPFASPFPSACSALVGLGLLIAASLTPARAGVALKLEFDSIPGIGVSNLTSSPLFPASPNAFQVLELGLQQAVNAGDEYGAWTRGFIEAPLTGSYTFWIASDDDSELWLSPTYEPAAKVRIVQNVGAVTAHGYFAKPSQQSAPITLVAGQKYYFELLHKENAGADHCSVAWTLPDGTFQDPLPSDYLWPYPVVLDFSTFPDQAKAPTILTDYLGVPVTALAPSTTVDDGRAVDLTISVEASQPASVQWFKNGVPLPNANLTTYRVARADMTLNGAIFSVTVSNALGTASASTALSVVAETTTPTLVDALNLGNPAGTIVVVFSEGVDPASAAAISHYSINNGVTVTSARIGSTPNTVLLRTAGLAIGPTYALTVNNVSDLASTPHTLTSASIPIESCLDSWLRLDEAGGTIARDASGNGRNGSFVSDVSPGYAGQVLKALKFNNVTGGHVRLAGTFSDFTTNGMTLALWAYPTTEGAIAGWNRFFDLANGAGSDNILFARNGSAPAVTFEVYNGDASGGKVTTPDGSLVINRWQHFVATMDSSGSVVIYKNGLPLTNGLTAVPNPLDRTNNFLGLSNWSSDYHYAGRMDDVRIYSRVLSPEAVRALASGGGADDQDPSLATVIVTASVASTALKSTPPGVFSVTRSSPTNSALTVLYALGGSATNGVAYSRLTNQVVIPAGAFTAQVQVTPIDYSFQQLSQTVLLTLAPSTNYNIGDADADTVTIQNNDVNPAAIVATADNALGTVTANTIDVWFAAPVANPSATSLANYTLLNAPGLTLTGATLGNRNLRVVLSLSGPVPTNALLSVSGVLDPGGNSVSSQIPIRGRLDPVNVVANIYHAPAVRATCFSICTNGVVSNNDNGSNKGFDTWGGTANAALTQFAGLLYAMSQDVQAIKVDLGRQFGDGGNWQAQPLVYLLKNPIDTASLRPEANTNWVQVPAALISGSQFQTAGDANPSPNTPLVFDLSALPAAQRTCYGWAVGGVKGNGANGFLSITELRAYGAQGTNNTIVFVQQPQDRTGTEGQRVTFVELATNGIAPLTFQWRRDGSDIAGATDVNFSPAPLTLGDNGALFDVVVKTVPPVATLTSRLASLAVTARTAPPQVVAATLDLTNSLIEVWFDATMEAGSATTAANFTLNDPALSVTGAAQDANGYRVSVSFLGVPTQPNLTVKVTNLQDFLGRTLPAQTVPVLPLNEPALNVVANAYQQGRALARVDSTNGLIVHATGDANVWATYEGTVNPNTSDFVGLIYPQPQVFGVLKVDLGWQFGDGGDWELEPRVFILKRPVDTDQIPPENDPVNWVPVPATLLSGNVFNYGLDGPTGEPSNTPIAFDVSHLSLSQRTGYGWAVGGVPANQTAHFLSVTELSAFGTAASAATNLTGPPQLLVDVLPPTLILPAGVPLSYAVSAAGTQPIAYQWQLNGVNLTDNDRILGARSNILSLASTTPSDAGTYRLILSNSVGVTTSASSTVSLSGIALNDGAGWTRNGGAFVSANAVTLTDSASQARSCFLNMPQFIGAFTASFLYQDVGGGGADGVVFVLQNAGQGSAALGGAGGGLGFYGITPSAGVLLNIYANNTLGVAFRTNGATGAPYSSSAPVNLASGNPISVALRYDASTLTLSLKDTVTGTSFNTNWAANLPQILGANTAYVGFTGGSGSIASRQRVSNFSFASLVRLAFEPDGTRSYRISWPASAGGLVLKQSTDLGGNSWVPTPEPLNLVGEQNQVTVSPSSNARFFRLATP